MSNIDNSTYILTSGWCTSLLVPVIPRAECVTSAQSVAGVGNEAGGFGWSISCSNSVWYAAVWEPDTCADNLKVLKSEYVSVSRVLRPGDVGFLVCSALFRADIPSNRQR